jgi:hypothetical protein
MDFRGLIATDASETQGRYRSGRSEQMQWDAAVVGLSTASVVSGHRQHVCFETVGCWGVRSRFDEFMAAPVRSDAMCIWPNTGRRR